jgi:hypothetical protein
MYVSSCPTSGDLNERSNFEGRRGATLSAARPTRLHGRSAKGLWAERRTRDLREARRRLTWRNAFPLAGATMVFQARFARRVRTGRRRATQSRKTLRKSALKSLKKLARANWRAPQHPRGFTTGRSWRSVRLRRAPCRLRGPSHPSTSFRAPKGLRPSPAVQPARPNGRR